MKTPHPSNLIVVTALATLAVAVPLVWQKRGCAIIGPQIAADGTIIPGSITCGDSIDDKIVGSVDNRTGPYIGGGSGGLASTATWITTVYDTTTVTAGGGATPTGALTTGLPTPTYAPGQSPDQSVISIIDGAASSAAAGTQMTDEGSPIGTTPTLVPTSAIPTPTLPSVPTSSVIPTGPTMQIGNITLSSGCVTSAPTCTPDGTCTQVTTCHEGNSTSPVTTSPSTQNTTTVSTPPLPAPVNGTQVGGNATLTDHSGGVNATIPGTNGTTIVVAPPPPFNSTQAPVQTPLTTGSTVTNTTGTVVSTTTGATNGTTLSNTTVPATGDTVVHNVTTAANNTVAGQRRWL